MPNPLLDQLGGMGGGMPGGGMGMPGGGMGQPLMPPGGGDQEILQQLMAMSQQMGISIQDLISMLMQGGGGMPGSGMPGGGMPGMGMPGMGMPPGGGGMPGM